MTIWYRGWKGLPKRLQAIALTKRGYMIEGYDSPSGARWYRERSEQEAADLKRILTEHHPTFDGGAEHGN